MANLRDTEGLYNTKTAWTWHPIAIAVGLGLIALGVFMLINPRATLSTVALILGVVLVLRAVVFLFSATKSLGAGNKSQATLGYIAGGVLAIVGLVLIISPDILLNALFAVAAIVFILDSLTNLLLLPRLWELNRPLAVAAGLANALVLAAAIMMLLNPELGWYSQNLGLGVGMTAWGATYAFYGIGAATMRSRGDA
ncbi:DUF308 domain-containing protein [Trueperella bialowiezensis]|uniref:Uncharacterized conserved protein n=1 Tax=Trueperella bialowiezensis TaxID=312285 RepID=A0A448PDX4_9ACTO|nr:DUF308 domain-containing protein [Trueperella bialowiezensis]VEI13137.1 Uncharacterized conserved protein [Trueperella bialowiezensis]